MKHDEIEIVYESIYERFAVSRNIIEIILFISVNLIDRIGLYGREG